MKRFLLVFILLNFLSGCVEYNDFFHHDNGRKCGHREDHCDVGHQGHKNKHHDEHRKNENHQGDNDNGKSDNGSKGKKGNKKD